jgi:hypothetical protein
MARGVGGQLGQQLISELAGPALILAIAAHPPVKLGAADQNLAPARQAVVGEGVVRVGQAIA